ncbi:protein kinase domain-containing protein [Cryptosporidium serpentis]
MQRESDRTHYVYSYDQGNFAYRYYENGRINYNLESPRNYERASRIDPNSNIYCEVKNGTVSKPIKSIDIDNNYKEVREYNWKRITSNTFYGDPGPHLANIYSVPEDLIKYYEIYDGTSGVLGRGAYSSVFKIRSRRSGQIYALKVMSIEHFTCRGLGNQLKREIDLQSRCCHSNIVKLYRHYEKDRYIFLILEFVETNLFNIIHYHKYKRKNFKSSSYESPNGMRYGEYLTKKLDEEYQVLSTSEIIHYITQLLKGINYLHSKNIIHRDIKPENILLTSDNIVKIGDFGWCGDLNRSCSSIAGTFCYMAPEILKGQCQTSKVDCWSIGIVLYELLVGKVPFSQPYVEDDHNNSCMTTMMLNSIRNLHYIPKPSNVSHDAWHLCCWLLRYYPSERASTAEALNHPYLKNSSYEMRNSGMPIDQKLLFNLRSRQGDYISQRICPKISQNYRDVSNFKLGNNQYKRIYDIPSTALPLVAVPTPKNTSRNSVTPKNRQVSRMVSETPIYYDNFYNTSEARNTQRYYQVSNLHKGIEYKKIQNFREIPTTETVRLGMSPTLIYPKISPVLDTKNLPNRYVSQPPLVNRTPNNNIKHTNYYMISRSSNFDGNLY